MIESIKFYGLNIVCKMFMKKGEEMKLVLKSGVLILLIFLTMNSTEYAHAYASTEMPVICNDLEVGKAEIISEKVYVPLRSTLEAMNFTVDWNPTTLDIVVKNDYLTTVFNGWKVARINGFDTKFNDALKVINGHTYISLDTLNKSTNLMAKLLDDRLIIMEDENYENFSYIVEQQKVTTLMYHHILSEEDKVKGGWSKNGAVNSLESFEVQMAYIKENNFNTISVKELEDFIYSRKPLPQSNNHNNILITFDDGYLSNYINAYPIMKKYNLNGVIFHVTTNTPEESVTELDILKLDRISLEQMRVMSDIFEHELHTDKGHDKVNNVADMIWMSKEEIIEDLENNRNKLPEDSRKKYFAYPFGMFDDETIDALKYIDVKLAFTTKDGYTNYRSNPYKLKRFGVYPWVKIEKFKSYLNN